MMAQLEVPLCFQRRDSRSGQYRDLSAYNFTGSEKTFIVKQIILFDSEGNSRLSIIPFGKEEINRRLCFKGVSLVAERYNISKNTVKSWRKRFLTPAKVGGSHRSLQDSVGRPPDFDYEAKEKFKNALIQAEVPTAAGIQPLSLSQTHDLAIQCKIDSKLRRLPPEMDPNMLPTLTKDNVSLDPKTESKLKAETNARDRTPQYFSNARNNALIDITLFYITAVFTWIVGRFLPACCKWNADCTTFIVASKGEGQKVCVVREKGEVKQVLIMK
jgi:hypothetical protein